MTESGEKLLQRLQERLKELDISVAELARQTGLTDTRIRHWEDRGSIPNNDGKRIILDWLDRTKPDNRPTGKSQKSGDPIENAIFSMQNNHKRILDQHDRIIAQNDRILDENANIMKDNVYISTHLIPSLEKKQKKPALKKKS